MGSDLAFQYEQRLLPLGVITDRLRVRRLQLSGVARLTQSIQRAGFLETFPLLVWEKPDGTFQFLDGNHRYEAALALALPSVPCVIRRNLNEQERYTLVVQANRAAETVIPSTLVTYAEFVWQQQAVYNQQEIAEMLGWGRTQVANYAALQRIHPTAWEVIVTTMERSVTTTMEDAVTGDVTGVTFTENLLRAILGLTAEQQYELVQALAHPDKQQRITKGKFQELAKAYQIRNTMSTFALQHLEDLGEVFTSQLQTAVYSGAYDQDWQIQDHPKLQRLLTALREEWEQKHRIHLY